MRTLKTVVFGAAAIMLIALSGCTHNRELYERLIIKAIGIDRSGTDYSVTVRVADYAENKEYNLVSSGESVFEAMSDLQLAEGRTPMYSHSHYILLGREVLHEDLRQCLDFFIRYYKAHPSVQIFAADKSAKEILEYKNEDGFIPSDRMIKLSDSGDISGKAMATNLMKLVSDSEGMSASSAIPMLELTQNGAAVTGTVLLRDYRMVNVISGKETSGLLAASGKLKNNVYSADSKEFGFITAEAGSCRSRIVCSDDYTTWQIDVKLDLTLASSSIGARDFSDEDFTELEAIFAVTMRNYISSAISAAYSSGCDILQLGQKIYFEDTDYWKNGSDLWLSMLPSMNFNINVAAEIERLGEEDHSGR